MPNSPTSLISPPPIPPPVIMDRNRNIQNPLMKPRKEYKSTYTHESTGCVQRVTGMEQRHHKRKASREVLRILWCFASYHAIRKRKTRVTTW